MSQFGIKDWNHGETFAIYNSNMGTTLTERDGVTRCCELCILEKQIITVYYKKERLHFISIGDWPAFSDGDLVYIKENGSIQILYVKGQPEVDLFITNKCNSNCVMCPLAETVRKRESPGQLQWILDYISLLPEDLPYINITGGEPTLEGQQFLTVMSRLRDKFQHTEFQLLTNGRSLADRKYLTQLIANMPYNIRFAIPLHSSCEKVHDGITQSKGSFIQTDYAIRNLLDLQQKVELRIVVSRLNIPTIKETVEYIEKEYKGIFVVNFIGMEMMGNAAKNRAYLWEDYLEVFRKIRESVHFLIIHGIDTQLYNFPLCAVEPGYWPLVAKSITGYKIRYKDECNECAVKDICGGFFYSTLRLMNPSVQVIKR